MDLSVTPLETHPCKNQIPYSTIGNSEEAHLMIWWCQRCYDMTSFQRAHGCKLFILSLCKLKHILIVNNKDKLTLSSDNAGDATTWPLFNEWTGVFPFALWLYDAGRTSTNVHFFGRDNASSQLALHLQGFGESSPSDSSAPLEVISSSSLSLAPLCPCLPPSLGLNSKSDGKLISCTSTLDNMSFKPVVCSWVAYHFRSSKVLFSTGGSMTFWMSSDPEKDRVLEIGETKHLLLALVLHTVVVIVANDDCLLRQGNDLLFLDVHCSPIDCARGACSIKASICKHPFLNWCGESNSGTALMITSNLRPHRSTTQHEQFQQWYLRNVHTDRLGVVHEVQATFFGRFAESGNESWALCQQQIWDAFWPFGMWVILAGKRHRIREVVAYCMYNSATCELAWQSLSRK